MNSPEYLPLPLASRKMGTRQLVSYKGCFQMKTHRLFRSVEGHNILQEIATFCKKVK